MNLKSIAVFIFLLCSGLASYGQISFTSGYIVNNRHERFDCQIRNIGNAESTMNYEYRLPESGKIEKIELSRIEEFGIDNELKCIRAMIAIDISPRRINHLRDTVSNWDEGHAYIKVLVEGKSASLFSYFDSGEELYFYNTENAAILPLIHKKYQIEVASGIVDRILEDNSFREQLKQHVSCGDQGGIEHIPYSKKALVTHFINFNRCRESDLEVLKSAQIKKGSFRLKAGVNANHIRLTVKEFSDALPRVSFSGENTLGFGAEAEYLFSYNNYKWGVFAECNFYTYQSDSVGKAYNVSIADSYVIDYKTLEFPVGIVFYMNLNEEHRLFARAGFVPHVILSGSQITFNPNDQRELSPSSCWLFGAGYNFKRVAAEFRYYSDQNITSNIYKRGSGMSHISVRLTYTLFKTPL